MARDLSTENTSATLSQLTNLVWFGEFTFTGGIVRIWTGLGEITALGEVWTGAGALAGIGTITETPSVESGALAVQLSGIPSEYLAVALQHENRGRFARIYCGYMSADWSSLVDDPNRMWVGRMGAMQIADDGGTITIRVPIEGLYFDIRRPRTRRMSHVDQQRRFQGDLGLKYLTWAASQTFYFASKGTTLPPAAGGSGSGVGSNTDRGSVGDNRILP